MRRLLLRSASFVRALKRTVKAKPQTVADVEAALTLLAEDAFHPSLRTHKLQGQLEGSWACSAGYDVRVIFSFVQHQGREAILLESLGSHDEVY